MTAKLADGPGRLKHRELPPGSSPVGADPLVEVGGLGPDGGLVPVPGEHPGPAGQHEQAGADRLDDGGEVREAPSRGPGPASEQRVTGEEDFSRPVVQAAPAG